MDKRMAGDYEIIQSFHIGDQEVVIGENLNALPEERYMCAFCQQNEIVALYNDVLVSDDFCEIAKLYGKRLGSGAFPPSVRFKKREIHTGFHRFLNLRLGKNLSPPALAE